RVLQARCARLHRHRVGGARRGRGAVREGALHGAARRARAARRGAARGAARPRGGGGAAPLRRAPGGVPALRRPDRGALTPIFGVPVDRATPSYIAPSRDAVNTSLYARARASVRASALEGAMYADAALRRADLWRRGSRG